VRVSALLARTRALNPDAVVPVAFSGFNLRFGRCCREAGLPVVYVSPPQVWAWGGWRIRELRRAADSVVCLLPFEQSLLRRAGLDATYFGHPLIDSTDELWSREETRAALGLPRNGDYVAFLPGSRPEERSHHSPLFRELAAVVEQGTGSSAVFVEIGDQHESETVQDVEGRYSIIKHAAAAVVVSGTATLETALLGTPQVVCYHLGQPSRLLARLLVRVRHFALPNIVLGRSAIPELLEPTVRSTMAELKPLLTDPDRRRRMLEDYAEIRRVLGPPGAAKRIAEHVVAVAQGTDPKAAA
jgi:lipid-A-disaccharide synthase